MTTDHNDSTEAVEHTAPATTEKLLWMLYAAILQTALVLLDNEPEQAVWLVVLLAAGIGQGLMLPSRFAWFGGLAAVVLWVMFRQTTGVWVRAELLQSMLEIAGLALNIFLAVRLRQSWEPLEQDMEELQTLRRLLVAGEAGTGLLPWQVAELRLLEEVDRAKQFRRPLGMLLVEIEDLAESPAQQTQALEARQALVRQLVSTSLVHDIPFRMGPNQVGLILPERNWDSLYQDAESIINALKGAVFLDDEGRSHHVLHLVKLSFGLATYQGETSGTIDLMGAAQDSLSVSRDLAGIGEISVSAYAMPATPIVGSQALAADEEE